MKSIRAVLYLSVAASLLAAPVFAATAHRAAGTTRGRAASHKTTTHGKTSARAPKASRHKLHGQQSIDAERVTQIQQALIREHYMTGEASGQWDPTTQAAMQKYQADQGWQTRLMPDSRALMKLGLGPDYSTAINAHDVASSAPAAPGVSSIPAPQSSGFATASGVNQ